MLAWFWTFRLINNFILTVNLCDKVVLTSTALHTPVQYFPYQQPRVRQAVRHHLAPYLSIPTHLCLLTPPSLFDTVSLVFLLSLSLTLFQSLFFPLCHFPSAFLCHYSAHMSRLKRELLLLACVKSVCGSVRLTLCVCVSPLLSALGLISVFTLIEEL